MKQFKIEIPTPCHEGWDQMTPQSKGRFCGSCEKIVVDFTGMSASEISETLLNKTNICGRIKQTQLQQTYFHPNKSYHFAPITSIAAGFLLLLSPLSVWSQSIQQGIEKVETKIVGEIAMVSSPLQVIAVKVIDNDSLVIANQLVKIVNTTDSVIASALTNEQGEVNLSFEQDLGQTYSILIEQNLDFYGNRTSINQLQFKDGKALIQIRSREIDRMIMGKFVITKP